MSVNRCVCCGADIPEGRQICSECEERSKPAPVDEFYLGQHSLKKCPRCDVILLYHSKYCHMCGQAVKWT